MLDNEIIAAKIECLKIADNYATSLETLKENYAELVQLIGIPENE